MKKLVPISVSTLNDKTVHEIIDILLRINADEVLFALIRLNEVEKYCSVIKKYKPYFEEKNIKTAIWIESLSGIKSDKYQNMQRSDETVSDLVCPLCDEFVNDFCECIKKLAQCGIKKLVLDDDFRMHTPFSRASCFCDKHIALYSEMLGEKVTKEIMADNIYSNTANKYRSAWLKANQDALEKYAKSIREAVDSVDKEIDVMLCCGPSLFGADGTDPIALAKLLSSKEKPSLRLSGAPYWQNAFHLVSNMMSAVDFTRHQALYCKNKNIETIAEGDPYPRPRNTVPASHLEAFHTILLADGNVDKIQKYVIDYYSSPYYETGYINADIKNHSLYEDIERIFKDKKAVGINLIEDFDRMYFVQEINPYPENGVISSAGRDFLNSNSFPAIFEQGGVNLIFGQNAHCFDKDILKNGTILDIEAAKILSARGIDVGFEACEEAIEKSEGSCNPNCYEYYCEYDENVGIYGNTGACNVKLKNGCEVSSVLYRDGMEYVGAYFYENHNGERFFVYNFNAENDNGVFGLFKSYCRQKQLIKAYEKLNGSKFEAVCTGNPDLYMMVKKNDTSLAVGLWNYFADEISKPVIELSEKYDSAEFINCNGTIQGNKIVLDSPVCAYGYCFIELNKN